MSTLASFSSYQKSAVLVPRVRDEYRAYTRAGARLELGVRVATTCDVYVWGEVEQAGSRGALGEPLDAWVAEILGLDGQPNVHRLVIVYVEDLVLGAFEHGRPLPACFIDNLQHMLEDA